MTIDIALALMAGRAYYDTRADINRFPVPDGWTEKLHEAKPCGFEAVSFQRGDEIVISYAGTYDKSFGDLAADLALGVFGVSSTQLYEATEYYMQVRADNSNAKITLTGHSLGGGLASLIAVFFDETATTFDQAPFRNSASWITATELRTYLTLNFPAETYPQISDWLAPLDRFILSFDPAGLGWSPDGLKAREAKVANLSVQGEFLSVAPAFRIGTELPPLTHGDYFGPFDLHAQSLLTAFVENDQFREVTNKLTDLLGMIFDKNLYSYNPNDPEYVNFLEHLIRHQEGLDPTMPNDGDAMLDRFTSDLQLIAQDGGLTMTNSDLTKALIAFAMQAYYFNRPESDATLFDAETGGIHFDRTDVADTLDAAKGYNMYFTNYLATLPTEDRDRHSQDGQDGVGPR